MPVVSPLLHDVAIVGYGPTGALLANLLGQAGLSAVVVERDRAIHALPRAVHFDGETMRNFQSVGLADQVGAIARPSAQGMHFVNAAGQTLMVRRGREGVGPQGWANNWYFHQPELEAVLRQGVTRHASVRVLPGHEVVAVGDRGDQAALSVRATDADAGTTPETLAARYVVGCDGARSLVRRAIGSTTVDLGLHQPWLVVDMICDTTRPRVQALPPHTVQWCDPARPMTIVRVNDSRRRWEIMAMPGDDMDALARPEVFWPMIARWIGPDDATPERAAVYTFHSVVVEGWRRGRLLLAGDACHQTPPFLGQGMCAGLRDAANLAWKLAAVLRGQAGEALLDPYESERAPHVRTFIELAVRLGAVIQPTDPAIAAERDRRFAEGGTELFDFPQPQLGPGCHASGPPPVGSVFQQPLLGDGRRLDDVAGWRFALLGDDAVLAHLGEATLARLAALDVAVIADLSPALEAGLAVHGARALLLRPDRYLMGFARDEAGIAALLDLVPAA